MYIVIRCLSASSFFASTFTCIIFRYATWNICRPCWSASGETCIWFWRSRFSKTKRVRWSRSIVWAVLRNSLVVSGEISNAARWPSSWVDCIVHISSNVCTSLSILIFCTPISSEVVPHAKVMSDFMGNNLSSKWENVQTKYDVPQIENK